MTQSQGSQSKPTPPSPNAAAKSDLVMPPAPGEQGGQAVVVPAPPSLGRQMAQLVIIPGVIVLVAVGVALLFGKVASASDSLENQLLKLKQSSGAGKMAFDLQDPRYKDRSLAAYNIATLIPTLKEPADRLKVSKALTEILERHVSPQEEMLQVYLLTAIGQLGQEGGLDAIRQRLTAEHAKVREGAVGGILAWPNPQEARIALPALTAALNDASPMVREKAAAAVGELATAGDDAAIKALREAASASGSEMREVVWNASIALARLGDAQGARFVADVLLDRSALAQMPEGEAGSAAQEKMSRTTQDHVILSTLAAARTMTDPQVWDKIREIADRDPNRAVQSAARQLLALHVGQ